MNIAVTIFYALAGAYLVAIFVVYLVKRHKKKKAQKEVQKEVDNVIKSEEKQVSRED